MHAEHDDMIACIQTVADHGGLTTVVVGIAVGCERVTQYIVRSLAPDAYQTLMRDIDAAIDADLVEATVAAWCAVEG
jgi:hypothetical protein